MVRLLFTTTVSAFQLTFWCTPGEFDSKEEAVRNLCEKANLDFVMQWLRNGGASQLHQTVA
jgi:hypothetical protein